MRFCGTLSKSFLNSLARHCHHLQLISFTNCFSTIVDLELGYLFQNCVQLRSVELKKIQITGRCLNDLPVEMKSISFIECESLENQEVQNVMNRCLQLETLELMDCSRIAGDTLLYTLPNLVELRTLCLTFIETSQGRQLSINLSVLSRLTQLDLSSNEWVNDETLMIISKSLINLRKLDVYGCHNITDDGISHLRLLPCFTSLNLTFCDHITDESIKSMAKLGRLNVLEFEDYDEINSEAIMELAERCLNLTKLVLSSCPEITDRCVETLAKLRHLKVLNLIWCSNVTNDAVKALTENAPPLIELDLYQSKITDIGVKMLIKLDRLELLYLSSNENITDDSVKVSAKCKNLRNPYLNGCNKLQWVLFFHSLTTLTRNHFLYLCTSVAVELAKELNALQRSRKGILATYFFILF